MQRLLLSTALAFLMLSSCSKDDNSTTTTTSTSVSGSFSITYPAASYTIDSMRTYYLNAAGTVDSATVRGTNTWSSPARTYKSGDSAYAKVFAWGTGPLIGAPTLSFSQSITAKTSSQITVNGTLLGRTGIMTTYGFRLQ